MASSRRSSGANRNRCPARHCVASHESPPSPTIARIALKLICNIGAAASGMTISRQICKRHDAFARRVNAMTGMRLGRGQPSAAAQPEPETFFGRHSHGAGRGDGHHDAAGRRRRSASRASAFEYSCFARDADGRERHAFFIVGQLMSGRAVSIAFRRSTKASSSGVRSRNPRASSTAFVLLQ